MIRNSVALLLINSLMFFVSCNGGGGGGSKSSKQKGAGSFTITSGPTNSPTSCFEHKAASLGSANCNAISGTHNSTTISQCVGATGSFNSCDYGSPVTECRIGSVKFTLQLGFDTAAVESCEYNGGVIHTTCTGISQTDCSAANGNWETRTVNTCTSFDVDNEANCLTAGGKYKPNVRYLVGDVGDAHLYGGTKIIKGKNMFSIDVTDDGSDPRIFSMSASMDIVATPSDIYWTSTFSLTPDAKFYDDDWGYLYFDATSPVGSNETGVDVDGDDLVDFYTSFTTGTLYVE